MQRHKCRQVLFYVMSINSGTYTTCEVYTVWLSVHAFSRRLQVLQFGAAFSSPAFSDRAFLTVPRFPVSRFQSPKLFIIAGFVDSLDACADAVVAKCPDRMHAGAVMLWPIRLSVCLISNELKKLPGL